MVRANGPDARGPALARVCVPPASREPTLSLNVRVRNHAECFSDELQGGRVSDVVRCGQGPLEIHREAISTWDAARMYMPEAHVGIFGPTVPRMCQPAELPRPLLERHDTTHVQVPHERDDGCCEVVRFQVPITKKWCPSWIIGGA